MNRNQPDPSFCQVEEPEPQPFGRVVFSTSVEKYPTGRALAAAFWLSYFALHWLLILDVVEFSAGRAGATIFFFVTATLLSIASAANEEKKSE